MEITIIHRKRISHAILSTVICSDWLNKGPYPEWQDKTRLAPVGQSTKARLHSLPKYVTNHRSGEKYQFICIQNPDDAKDRTTRRLARSHAVARGLERKRRRLQQSGHNFRIVSLKDGTVRKTTDIDDNTNLSTVSHLIVAPGPFQLLAAESPILQALLSQRKV